MGSREAPEIFCAKFTWQFVQVVNACGLTSPNAMVSDVEGSLTLSIPNLCGAAWMHQVFSDKVTFVYSLTPLLFFLHVSSLSFHFHLLPSPMSV